jgi:hypothetical protein
MKIYKYIILLSFFLVFVQPAWASTPGNAVLFNGSSDYASVANSSELNLTNNGTWEFWINRSATSDETLFLLPSQVKKILLLRSQLYHQIFRSQLYHQIIHY